MRRAQSNISYESLPCSLNKRRNTFILLTEKEFIKYSWWFADGTQPISNGQTGYILDKNNEPTRFITCCGNCGDYKVHDMIDHTLEMHDKLSELKKE